MVNLVLFYIVFILYNTYITIFLIKKVKEFKFNIEGIDKGSVTTFINSITKKLFYITIVVFVICFLLLSTINYVRNIESTQIGLALSVATVVFFVIFLLWDIIKEKLINYFNKSLSIDIKDIFLERLHFLIISLYAIILFLAVISIISILLI
ncbi:MAG TPA: hypothetical protein GXZ48_02760 [Acholeplasmataceae bacterium]|nr:hypothetical protein [Acholeplasmataceae bacterium]